MGKMRFRGQGDLLALLEPVPTLPATTRAALVPLVAALLLEAADSESATNFAVISEREGRDEQDRA